MLLDTLITLALVFILLGIITYCYKAIRKAYLKLTFHKAIYKAKNKFNNTDK